jgi:DNA-binding response OmpR family regulator
MGQPRILVVDDDRLIRTTLRLALERDECRVDDAGTCAEAMGLLDRFDYDMVYTDFSLPDCDGLQLLDYARKIDPAAAVVLMTGSALDEIETVALERGAIAVIAKPFQALALAGEARDIMRRRSGKVNP